MKRKYHNPARYSYFKRKPIILGSRYERWKRVAQMIRLSKEGLRRLGWIIYYETKAEFNASKTCRHFDIPAKTFYKYLNRFDSANLKTLEDRSRAPRHVRQKEITLEQEQRVVTLRKQFIHYGKEKLRDEYRDRFGEDLSCWKILYTIQKHHLYPQPLKTERNRATKAHSRAKRRISQLKVKNKKTLGHLVQLDTIVLHLFGLKRYILTAIDIFGKLAFGRVYKNPSSFSAADFLRRLNYLLDDQIVNIQTDNGSEFAKYFERACQNLQINHYFSRNRTPQDNAVLERFNRTLKDEWLSQGGFSEDIPTMNRNLTEWFVHYNFHRRHSSLNNLSPIDYCIKHRQLLPMYSTATWA